MSAPVRTRIAPSPTGSPHIGTAFIALHNMAFARHHGGQFILRIEDTDQVRSSAESEKQILECLKWLGLDWHEGPDCGGDHGPYRQSERLDIYAKYAQELIDTGKAYRCFCTKERLDSLRQSQLDEGKDRIGYDGHCRNLSEEEIKTHLDAETPYVVRLKVEQEGKTSFFDEIRQQDIEFDNAGVDDQILMKMDGFPTYHLANVVDDHLMKITHVMRGEEWISSTPKHVMLYEAFGWDKPKFYHFPLLRNHDKSKISKRKNPTSLLWFMAKGYTRDALQNFLALMGYSFEDGREFFSLSELIESYDSSRLSTTAPIFDFDKLDRINSQHIMSYDSKTFCDFMDDATRSLVHYVEPLFPEILKRCKSRSDIENLTAFLFEREPVYTLEMFKIKKMNQANAITLLSALAKKISKQRPSYAESFNELIKAQCEESEIPGKGAFMLLRIVIMKSSKSLPLFEVLEFLGPDLVSQRLKVATQFVKQGWPS